MSAPRVTSRPDAPPPWLRKTVLVIGGVMLLVILYLVASAALPRWWAQTVGGQVDGVPSTGVLVGLLYGFLFTIIPIAVGAIAAVRGMHWKARVAIGVVALLLTLPNLLTLAVALGGSEAARDGRAVIAVEAPSFRGATAAGVLIAAAVAVLVAVIAWRLVTSRREIARLRGKVSGDAVEKHARDERDEAAEEARTRAARDTAARARAAAPPPVSSAEPSPAPSVEPPPVPSVDPDAPGRRPGESPLPPR